MPTRERRVVLQRWSTICDRPSGRVKTLYESDVCLRKMDLSRPYGSPSWLVALPSMSDVTPCSTFAHRSTIYNPASISKGRSCTARANIYAPCAQLVGSCHTTMGCLRKLWMRRDSSRMVQEEGLFVKGTWRLGCLFRIHSPFIAAPEPPPPRRGGPLVLSACCPHASSPPTLPLTRHTAHRPRNVAGSGIHVSVMALRRTNPDLAPGLRYVSTRGAINSPWDASTALRSRLNLETSKVAEYFQKVLGEELDWELHVTTLEELSNAPFDVCVAEQKVGDLVLVPPRSVHQVVNRGCLAMKTSWSRMTLRGLKTALHGEIPIYRRYLHPSYPTPYLCAHVCFGLL